MAMLAGPRQVGKTTSARASAGDHRYYTWDRQSDRRLLTQGADAIASDLDLATLGTARQRLVLDEIHKYRKWKDLLKGLFDVYGEKTSIVVRLRKDITFTSGGWSPMAEWCSSTHRGRSQGAG